jgi:hypothetical protein
LTQIRLVARRWIGRVASRIWIHFFMKSVDEGCKKAGICKKLDKDGIILELDTPDHLPIGCERVMVCWQFRCKAAVGRPKRVS